MPITAIGAAACATTTFRVAGQLRVAVIVKATFLLVRDRPMAVIDPDPILAAGEYSDLVPYRPHADILLYGHARAFQGNPTIPLGVRLMVARGQEILLDKRLTVHGPGRQAGFGPRSPHCLARQHLLNMDAARLSAPIPDLPANFAWGYFNAAPDDQRIDFLRGDEWIGFEGMHSQIARVQSCLPGVRGAARLYGPSPGLRAGRPIALEGDTLTIDADQLRCWVVWRGSFAISSEGDLERHHIFAGVDTLRAPLAFPASYPEERVTAELTDDVDPTLLLVPEPWFKRGEDEGSDTADLPLEIVAQPATPFEGFPQEPPRKAPARPLPPATPFEGALFTPLPPSSEPAPITQAIPPTARGEPAPESSKTLGASFLSAMARAAQRANPAHPR